MSDNNKKYPWIKSIFNNHKDDEVMNDVYAGPEPLEPPMERVYAGPKPLKPNRNQEPMQCVYAGPEYFNREMPESFAVNTPEEPEKSNAAGEVVCQSCGSAIPEEFPFCPECGAPIPKEYD